VLVLALVGTLSLAGIDRQSESGPYPFADVATGQLIAYTGPSGIHLIRADGGRSWAVPGTGPMSGPEWEPDGQRLAAVDLQDCCKAYSFALDGSKRGRLPADSSTTPVWSPDGLRLAVFREEDTRIHLVPLRKGLRETVLPLSGNQPEWSPDGGLIAFQSNTGSDVLRIFVVRPDGSGLRALTGDTGDGTGASAASWSPDGRRIAFSSDLDGDEDIYVVNLDGTGLRKITHNSADDSNPTWSPDGRRIAFDRSTGDFDVTSIVVLNLATGAEDEIAREKDDGGGNLIFEPSWQPAPEL
jgi:Tol biopolymer transport system component